MHDGAYRGRWEERLPVDEEEDDSHIVQKPLGEK